MPSVDASLKKICYELPNSNFVFGDDENGRTNLYNVISTVQFKNSVPED
jgi:hypothetical protein